MTKAHKKNAVIPHGTTAFLSIKNFLLQGSEEIYHVLVTLAGGNFCKSLTGFR